MKHEDKIGRLVHIDITDEVNDMIQLCFLIESINIYPELNISGTKTSCKMINLHKEYLI